MVLKLTAGFLWWVVICLCSVLVDCILRELEGPKTYCGLNSNGNTLQLKQEMGQSYLVSSCLDLIDSFDDERIQQL